MRSGSDRVSVRSLCGRGGGETLQTYALICRTENIFVGTVKTIRRDTWKSDARDWTSPSGQTEDRTGKDSI